MALLDKDIIITPNKGQTAEPKIVFSGADATLGPQTISLNVYPTSNGTVSFEGTAGQLFSITNSLTGTIFSVNDVSGIPSIEVLDTGLIKLAQYSGNVLLGTGTDNTVDKLQINGSATATVLKSTVATGTAPFVVASTTKVANLNAALLDGVAITGFETAKVVVTVSSSSYTATATSGTTILLCNTASNNVTVNLPTAVGNTAVYEIKKISSANSMIIDGFSTQTIDGDQTITIVVENESLTLVSDNANWRVI